MSNSALVFALSALKKAGAAEEAISENNIKSLPYTGTGSLTHEITFPVIPKLIIAIQGDSSSTVWGISSVILWDITKKCTYRGLGTAGSSVSEYVNDLEYESNKLRITGPNSNAAFNGQDNNYMVYYI